MISSLDKTLHYMNCVSKDYHKFEFAGSVYEMQPKTEFNIRPSTFCKDECLSCGQCCRNYDTIMFPTDYDEIKRRADEGQEQYQFFLDHMDRLPIIVDGHAKEYLSVPPMTSKDNHDIWCNNHTVLNCRWIFLEGDKKYCRIHKYRCITCGFPHMEMYSNKANNVGYLGHKQFGRNWQLGCKVDIRRPLDQETLDDNIYWLNRLNIVADYMGVRTYLPEIIGILKDVDINNVPTGTITLSPHKIKNIIIHSMS